MKNLILTVAAVLVLLANSGAQANGPGFGGPGQPGQSFPGQPFPGQGYPPPPPPPPPYGGGYGGYGQLSSTPVQCYGGPLCNTTVSWSVQSSGYATQGIVTVQVPTSADPVARTERIMSCGAYGNTYVPWISQTDTYVFRLYVGNNCSYIPYSTAAVQQMVVHR